MATYKQGILGGFSGRIGNVIGTFWKGRQVMRIRAASFNDANTLRQQEQRMRFILINSFMYAQKELINWGFGAYDRTMSAMNAAKRTDEEAMITLPATWTAKHVTVYTFFVSEDGLSTQPGNKAFIV